MGHTVILILIISIILISFTLKGVGLLDVGEIGVKSPSGSNFCKVFS